MRPADPGGRGTLAVRGLTRVVSGTPLVADAGFTVPGGGLVALVGPNGAGKSTLLRLMAGTLPIGTLPGPSAGTSGAAARGAVPPEVRLDGTELLSMPRRERARLLALVEQETRAEFSLTVRQVVELGRMPHESRWAVGPREDGTVDWAMDRAGVRHHEHRTLDTLSGGEQQRVQLARALAQQPRLLLLDEPTNHLDIRAQLDTLQLLRQLTGTGLTVVAALHDLNLAAAYCDHVVVLADGRVRATGETGATLTPELVEETYGVVADVVTHPRTGRPLIAFTPAGSVATSAGADEDVTAAYS